MKISRVSQLSGTSDAYQTNQPARQSMIQKIQPVSAGLSQNKPAFQSLRKSSSLSSQPSNSPLSNHSSSSSHRHSRRQYYIQKLMRYRGAEQISVPSMYLLSGEGSTTKITKSELLARINQHNRLNNPYNSSHDPIDINSPQASSWDMFTEHEIAELVDRLNRLK